MRCCQYSLSIIIFWGKVELTSSVIRETIFVVDTIKLRALDFIEKPLPEEALLQKVIGAINEFQKNIDIITRYKLLTDKEKQIFA